MNIRKNLSAFFAALAAFVTGPLLGPRAPIRETKSAQKTEEPYDRTNSAFVRGLLRGRASPGEIFTPRSYKVPGVKATSPREYEVASRKKDREARKRDREAIRGDFESVFGPLQRNLRRAQHKAPK